MHILFTKFKKMILKAGLTGIKPAFSGLGRCMYQNYKIGFNENLILIILTYHIE